MAAINATNPNISGAYATMVKLSDNSIDTLANFLRAPGGRTITGYISGAYGAQIKTSAGAIKALADYWKTPGGDTITGSVQGTGYGGMIKDANNALLTISDQARIQYVGA